MRIRRFQSVLDECATAVQRGDTVDACLARYPQYADRLRPLLVLTERVRSTPSVAPRSWAQETAWKAVRERAADLRSGRRRAHIDTHYGMWLRPLAVAIALLFAVLFGTGATALAAQNALPDSPIYPVKLWTEDARLWFVFDDTHKANILMDQSDTRRDEIMSMVRQGKEIPDNVLSAMRDRNERASAIVAQRPQDTTLRARLLNQSASQEQLLISLWQNVSPSARTEYTAVVALAHNTQLHASGGLVSIQPDELSGGLQSIDGTMQPVGSGVWNVGGIEVTVDDRTIGSSELQAGTSARVIVGLSSSGRRQALSLSTIAAGAPQPEALVSGSIDEVTSTGIRISGQFFPFTPDTLKTLDLKQGERVDVTVGNTPNGIVATSVKAAAGSAQAAGAVNLTLEGAIEGDVSTNQWKVGGLPFLITGSTHVDAHAGKAQDGARVEVEASLNDGQLQAQSVIVLAAATAGDSVRIVGTFQAAQTGDWLVSGVPVVPPDGAAAPGMGSLVAIDARRVGTDLLVNDTVVLQGPDDTSLVRFESTIKKINGSTWDLGVGQPVQVASNVQSFGDAIVGARALVWGVQGHDGALRASFVWVLDQMSITATPTPSPAPTPAPTASP